MELKGKRLDQMIKEFEETKTQIGKIVGEIAKSQSIEILEEYRNRTEEEIENLIRQKLPEKLLESFEENKDFFVLKFRRECRKQIQNLKKSR